MQFRVLGPLEVVAADGRPTDPGSPKLRSLLTLLLADHGRVVPLDRINETLWSSEPPATATGTLQSYVSQLRRLLEPDRAPRAAPRRLLTRPPGYLLTVDADELDVLRFETALVDGQRLLDAGRPREADATLLAALALWRGEPYADLGDGGAAVQADRARLAELRAVALERHIDAMLAAGRPAEAVAELERLVAAHPLRERLWGSLMLALYRTGRQADALAAFGSCRALLRDELGIDPGPELRRLERAILTQDPTVEGPRPPVAARPEPAAPVDAAPAGGFVGRRAELATLVARMDAAVAGTGSVVLVAGEAGIGKTRLAEEAAAAAADLGLRVAWSRCADEAAAPALWPWTQVLLALGSDVGTRPAPGSGDSDARRTELFEQIADALTGAAGSGPLLVVLDDLHGADPLSLHLLRFLVGRIRPVPVVVLATLRDSAEERTDALVHTLADLARERVVTRLALDGLHDVEVGELLAGHGLPDGALAGELRRRTEGNPFFLVELIELLRSERRLDGRPGPTDIPASVRDVIERRLGRLPADTHALLTLAAVVGREFPLDVLEAAAEIDAEQIDALLEAAVITGMVVEGEGWAWRFSHELVRETIVGGLTRSQRARMHRQIARALERIPGAARLDALAHHSYLAGPFAGDGTALRHSVAAATAARERFAFATAAGHLARAVELVDGADAARTQELLVALGRDRRAAGDLVGAQAALSRAIALALEPGDTDRAAEAAGVFGGVALWPWRPYGTRDDLLIGRLDDLIAVTGSPRRRAELLGTLACELCYTERRPEGTAAAREAARIARDLDDVPLLGRALNNAYLAAWVPGEEAARRADLDEALGLAGLPAHTEAVARLHRGALAMRFAELDLARADLARAQHLATELGLAELRAQVSYQEAGHATLRGAWDLAEQHAEEAYALQQQTSLWGAGWCRLVQRMTVRRGQGRLAEVTAELVDGVVGEFAGLRPVAVLALAESGDPAAARRLLERSPVVLPQDWSTDFLLCAWGEVAALLGAPDPAALYRDLLPQAAELVVAGTANVCWGSVHGVLGRLAARTGDLDAARTHLAEAVHVDTALGALPWAGRARADLTRLAP